MNVKKKVEALLKLYFKIYMKEKKLQFKPLVHIIIYFSIISL